jgi:hypothetical protein
MDAELYEPCLYPIRPKFPFRKYFRGCRRKPIGLWYFSHNLGIRDRTIGANLENEINISAHMMDQRSLRILRLDFKERIADRQIERSR